jgi:hypothetical protein
MFDVTGTVERQTLAQPSDPPSSGGSGFPLSLPAGMPNPLARQASTTTFQHDGGNTFGPTDSSLGVRDILGQDTSHHFTLQLDADDASDVDIALTWSDSTGQSDLDLYASSSNSDERSATSNQPETISLKNVTGSVTLSVDPYVIVDDVTYQLTATVRRADPGTDRDGDGITDVNDQCPTQPGPAPSGCPDRDGDGVIDARDVCPGVPGSGADGCPVKAVEQVRFFVDGSLVSTEDVDTSAGPDSFAFHRSLPAGEHTLRVEWVRYDKVVATVSRTVQSID